MIDRGARTPDMRIDVSLGTFHDTHDVAGEALERVRKGLKGVGRKELKELLANLEAGQDLTDAETGIDAMYAMQYNDEIKLVRQALKNKE